MNLNQGIKGIEVSLAAWNTLVRNFVVISREDVQGFVLRTLFNQREFRQTIITLETVSVDR